MTVFLNLPPYLKDWLRNQWGPDEPLKIPRNAIEGHMLKIGLLPCPPKTVPMYRCPEGWTAVEVPQFRGINLDSRNFMSDTLRHSIEEVIRQRFDIDLWTLVDHAEFTKFRLMNHVEWWMESRGIADTETNFLAVQKRLLRLRERNRVSNHRRQNKKSDSQNQSK